MLFNECFMPAVTSTAHNVWGEYFRSETGDQQWRCCI